jgi:hypothetical protein
MISSLSNTKTTLTKIYLWIIGLVLALAVITGGVLYSLTWYWDSQTVTAKARMVQAEETLTLLQQRAWGLTLNENESGRWIHLPQGITVDGTEYTINNGRQQALLLIKKE